MAKRHNNHGKKNENKNEKRVNVNLTEKGKINTKKYEDNKKIEALNEQEICKKVNVQNEEKIITENNKISILVSLKKYIYDLDTGKAIFATVVAILIGFLSNFLLKVYNIQYWKSFFNTFEIPKEFYTRVESVINLSDIAIVIAVLLLYMVFYIKTKPIRFTGIIRCEKGKIKPILGMFFRLFLVPNIELIILFFVFAAIIILVRGLIIPLFISLGCIYTIGQIIALYNLYKNPSNSVNRISFLGFFSSIITLFCVSLGIIYFLGFINIYNFGSCKTIDINSENAEQTYIKILNLQDGYLCMPATINLDDESITLDTDEYRIVPNEEIITIKNTSITKCYVNSVIIGEGKVIDKYLNVFGYIIAILIFGVLAITIELKYIK